MSRIMLLEYQLDHIKIVDFFLISNFLARELNFETPSLISPNYYFFQAVRIVKNLDVDTLIAYHLTSNTTRGLFFPRDFVLGTKFGKNILFFSIIIVAIS